MAAAAGTLVGLWHRDASGGAPQYVETAMAESMATFVGEELLAAQIRGTNAPRRGNRDEHHAPQGVYPCAGHDRWLAISITTGAEWLALCDVAQLNQELASLDLAARHARHDEIDAVIAYWTRAHSPRQAMQRLQARGVIAAQVSDGRDLVEDPQLEARGFWAEVDQPDVGRRRYPGNPIKLSETPITYRRAAPQLGQHNDEVFAELVGKSSKELAHLLEEGVIADAPPIELEATTASTRSRPFG